MRVVQPGSQIAVLRSQIAVLLNDFRVFEPKSIQLVVDFFQKAWLTGEGESLRRNRNPSFAVLRELLPVRVEVQWLQTLYFSPLFKLRLGAYYLPMAAAGGKICRSGNIRFVDEYSAAPA